MKENRSCKYSFLLQHNLWLFLSCQFLTVIAQCDHGLESSCVWVHDPNTFLRWQLKKDAQDTYVELSECISSNCGIGVIQTSWLPPRDREVYATLHYKVYDNSAIFFRLNMQLEDSKNVNTLFSGYGDYAYGYPESWSSVTVKIPPSHTRYKLLLKGFLKHKEAMIAVKDINLDGSIILTSTSSSSMSTTSTTTTTASTRTTRRSTTSIATIPDPENEVAEEEEEEEEILPTHYSPEVEETGTRNSASDDEEDDEEDEEEEDRQLQSLEVQNFIGEEDLTLGFTEVVEPQLCMYK